MPGESMYPTANSTAIDSEKHKQLDQEIRDMIAALTKRLAELQHIHNHKSSNANNHGHGNAHPDASQHHLGHNDSDHHGQQIITLAGSNQGATMHGQLMEDKLVTPEDTDPYDALGTYVNSNFQAVNNSIMLGGSYTTNDPGVHMTVSDVFDHHQHHGDHDHHHLGHQDHQHHGQKHENAHEKKGLKKNKKDKANGKSQLHHSESSD